MKLNGASVPVCRPLLPNAERVLPYLRRIDDNRWYTNFGELVVEFEGRLAEMLGVDAAEVLSASSGTAAICGALLATAGWATPERPLCLLPSYTFVATVAAVRSCGYTPYFVDVDAHSWALDPQLLEKHAQLARAGAVVVVAPFGRPIENEPWAAFARQTNVPVLIDAAAAIDAIASSSSAMLGTIPVAVSLHATKALSTGEGGCVVWKDRDGVKNALRYLNFGVYDVRRSDVCGINGKMSEYAAAVGLAELDNWQEKRASYLRVATAYRNAAEEYELNERIITETSWASPYALFSATTAAQAERVRSGLEHRGIGSLLWYGRGCHTQPAYLEIPRDPLPITDALAPRILGLPMFPDMAEKEITTVVSTIAELMRSES